MDITLSEHLGFSESEIREMINWEKHRQLRLRHLPEDMSSDLKNKLRLGIPTIA